MISCEDTTILLLCASMLPASSLSSIVRRSNFIVWQNIHCVHYLDVLSCGSLHMLDGACIVCLCYTHLGRTARRRHRLRRSSRMWAVRDVRTANHGSELERRDTRKGGVGDATMRNQQSRYLVQP
ncbi:hypothetical protein CONLIGDRAFT_227944 [Coniochaeta ligniaria NRRL 30616]|uniref:Secreted protein n=1 Tax=Coniochaeta ligniaria NRRL 30616 TaxID=1408157 RepID=A0A1J7IV40_9PEZI|nr:hypothetical protein CONLIGDRAFT_227944 [Coniochaeta ligniaria NRRL 30616]